MHKPGMVPGTKGEQIMVRSTKNDRTITLTEPALKVYDSWPHMEKSKRVSDAIVAHSRTTTDLAVQVQDHEARLRRIERKEEEG
jgi:hypothetical protein